MLTKLSIEQYFIAEKNAGLFFLILGVASTLISIIIFMFLKAPLYKGAAWPLLIFGAIQIAVGFTIFSKSDKQRIDTVYAYDMDAHKLKTTELPRMQKVIRNITIFLALEFVLLASGTLLLWANRLFFVNIQAKDAAFWIGLGLILIIQSLIFSGADYLAFKRGKEYASQLQAFVNKP